MTANRKREPSDPTDQELRQALTILNEANADESAVDSALVTLVRLSSVAAPPQNFSRRVMAAVHRAPLSEGRIALATARPVWPRIAALGTAAAMVAWGAIATFGPFSAPMFVDILAFAVRVGLSMLTSTKLALQIWSAMATIGAALANALASPAVAIGLAATMLVAMLSLAALTQLLSAKQEPSQWHDNSSFV